MNDIQIFNFIKEHLTDSLRTVLTEDTCSDFVSDWVKAWNKGFGASSKFSRERAEKLASHSENYAVTFLERGDNRKSTKNLFRNDCNVALDNLVKAGKVKDSENAYRQFRGVLESYLAFFNDSGYLINDKLGANGNVTRSAEKVKKVINQTDKNATDTAKENDRTLIGRIHDRIAGMIDTTKGGRGH